MVKPWIWTPLTLVLLDEKRTSRLGDGAMETVLTFVKTCLLSATSSNYSQLCTDALYLYNMSRNTNFRFGSRRSHHHIKAREQKRCPQGMTLRRSWQVSN
jgi:hypothetical protein